MSSRGDGAYKMSAPAYPRRPRRQDQAQEQEQRLLAQTPRPPGGSGAGQYRLTHFWVRRRRKRQGRQEDQVASMSSEINVFVVFCSAFLPSFLGGGGGWGVGGCFFCSAFLPSLGFCRLCLGFECCASWVISVRGVHVFIGFHTCALICVSSISLFGQMGKGGRRGQGGLD